MGVKDGRGLFSYNIQEDRVSTTNIRKALRNVSKAVLLYFCFASEM